MNLNMRLAWFSVGLCCVGAVLQPLTRWWIVFIAPAVMLMGVNWCLLAQHFRDFNEAADLQQHWRRQRERCHPQ